MYSSVVVNQFVMPLKTCKCMIMMSSFSHMNSKYNLTATRTLEHIFNYIFTSINWIMMSWTSSVGFLKTNKSHASVAWDIKSLTCTINMNCLCCFQKRDISSSGMSSISHDDSLSVSSFRKTLDEETRRLNVLCTVWRDILESDKDGRLNDSSKVCAVLLMPLVYDDYTHFY